MKMSKILVSVFLCLAAASANALDVSGIKLGSTLEEAKNGILSLNKNYAIESFTMDGIPVAYRAKAPCMNEGYNPQCKADEIAIFQEQGRAVWSVARYQSFPNPKDRFSVSELVSNLQKKYGKDSRGDLGKDGYKYFVWAFDRSGSQRFGLSAYQPVMGKFDLGPCYINNAQGAPASIDRTEFPTTVNETCGQYVTASFQDDGNGFVQGFKVEVVDIAHIHDEMKRKNQAADAAQKRDADAQRAKGLKPNL
jgi:hypothetical protein